MGHQRRARKGAADAALMREKAMPRASSTDQSLYHPDADQPGEAAVCRGARGVVRTKSRFRVMRTEFIQRTRRTMVKHADRWPPTYYRAINQLADVIATFPPEKVPPSSCGRLQTIWRSLSIGDIGPITRPSVMPASLITASKSESVGENA